MNVEKKYKSLKVALNRVDDAFHFEAQGNDPITVHIDGAAAIGGANAGARPMELILMGLGGCSAIDIILILKKAKQVVTDFRIEIEGLRDAEKEPAPFEKIHIHFYMKGDIKRERAEKAIQLSMEKYCSVATMLNKTAEITWELHLETA